MRRRTFLHTIAALAAGASAAGTGRADTPASADLRAIDVRLPGDPSLARRALVLVPANAPAGAKLPLLVLLHGLGETGNERLGIHAWGELYGLVKAYERLLHPPFERTMQYQKYLTDQRKAEINAGLAATPFAGMVVACPVTPNPWKLEGGRTLDRYADWLTGTLLPAVRDRAPVDGGRAKVALDGCSLGGYVALETFLRKPDAFGVLGMVQAALGAKGAARNARRVADAIGRAGACRVHVETSTGDPYKFASQELARELTALALPCDLRVVPGPHDQPWLREIGTAEMLLWHDRKLR
jgi:enterochelin esterase-like enzyme